MNYCEVQHMTDLSRSNESCTFGCVCVRVVGYVYVWLYMCTYGWVMGMCTCGCAICVCVPPVAYVYVWMCTYGCVCVTLVVYMCTQLCVYMQLHNVYIWLHVYIQLCMCLSGCVCSLCTFGVFVHILIVIIVIIEHIYSAHSRVSTLLEYLIRFLWVDAGFHVLLDCIVFFRLQNTRARRLFSSWTAPSTQPAVRAWYG